MGRPSEVVVHCDGRLSGTGGDLVSLPEHTVWKEYIDHMKIREALGLKRTAKAVTKSAVMIKGAAIACVCLVGITSITYAISYFYDQYGSFTVSLNKYDMIQQGLTLSETPDFLEPISRLNADAIKSMTNIAEQDLPNNLDKINGDHHGDNYLAYTFYIKNSGKNTLTYDAEIHMSNVTNDVDEAIRLKLYDNGTPTTYAKTKKDGTGPELDTTEFLAADTIMRKRRAAFAPGDYDKYTVVIWLEGNDPDCLDDIIGGKLKLEMTFQIVEGS